MTLGISCWGICFPLTVAILLVLLGPCLPLEVADAGDVKQMSYEDGRVKREKVDIPVFKGCYNDSLVKCKDSRWCYTKQQRCDGTIHCPDASDEKGCPCRLRVAKEKLCDYIVDCPDFTDELGCFGCMAGQLWCKKDGAALCVEISKMCDGQVTCDGGEDEEHCRRLSLKQMDPSVVPSMRKEGYLHVKRGGQWLPFCGNNKQNLSAVVNSLCEELVGEREGKDTYRLTALNPTVLPEKMRWTHLNGTGEIYSSEGCSSKLGVYVNCSNAQCVSTFPSRQRRAAGKKSLATSGPREPTHGVLEDDRVRIVGGEDSAAGVWTFLVSLVVGDQHSCGGTIIAPEWILTAAHCLVPLIRLTEVHVGMLRKNSFSPYEQTSPISHYFSHDQYNKKTYENDVALVKLKTPLQLNRWVRPVCMERQSELPSGSACYVAGWGWLEARKKTSFLECKTDSKKCFPDHLQQVMVPLMKTCRKTFGNINDQLVVCAGLKEGKKDSCQGDSGGPLFCKGPGGWAQVGVVSSGLGCAQPDSPGLYTRVSYYLPWIQAKMGKMDSPSSPGPLPCKGITCKLTFGSCVPRSAICNGKNECLDGEDEMNCPQYYQVLPPTESFSTLTTRGTTGLQFTKSTEKVSVGVSTSVKISSPYTDGTETVPTFTTDNSETTSFSTDGTGSTNSFPTDDAGSTNSFSTDDAESTTSFFTDDAGITNSLSTGDAGSATSSSKYLRNLPDSLFMEDDAGTDSSYIDVDITSLSTDDAGSATSLITGDAGSATSLSTGDAQSTTSLSLDNAESTTRLSTDNARSATSLSIDDVGSAKSLSTGDAGSATSLSMGDAGYATSLSTGDAGSATSSSKYLRLPDSLFMEDDAGTDSLYIDYVDTTSLSTSDAGSATSLSLDDAGSATSLSMGDAGSATSLSTGDAGSATSLSIGDSVSATSLSTDDAGSATSLSTGDAQSTTSLSSDNAESTTRLSTDNARSATSLSIDDAGSATSLSTGDAGSATSLSMGDAGSATSLSTGDSGSATSLSIGDAVSATSLSTDDAGSATSLSTGDAQSTTSLSSDNAESTTRLSTDNARSATSLSIDDAGSATSLSTGDAGSATSSSKYLSLPDSLFMEDAGTDSLYIDYVDTTSLSTSDAGSATSLSLDDAGSATSLITGDAGCATSLSTGDAGCATSLYTGDAGSATSLSTGDAGSATSLSLDDAGSATSLSIGDAVSATSLSMDDAGSATSLITGDAGSATSLSTGDAQSTTRLSTDNARSATSLSTGYAGSATSLSTGDAGCATSLYTGDAGSATSLSTGDAGSATSLSLDDAGSATSLSTGDAGSATSLSTGYAGRATSLSTGYAGSATSLSMDDAESATSLSTGDDVGTDNLSTADDVGLSMEDDASTNSLSTDGGETVQPSLSKAKMLPTNFTELGRRNALELKPSEQHLLANLKTTRHPEIEDSLSRQQQQTNFLTSSGLINGSMGGHMCKYPNVSLASIREINCSRTEFVCAVLPQCVSWEAVCDGVRHCKDGTDETGCTCLDRLLKFHEDLDCDGHFDCFDLSDETCNPCGKDFLCARSRACVPYEKVCNSITDCVYGEDELDCIGLLEEAGSMVGDKFGRLVERSQGTLVLRSGPSWSTVCLDHMTEDMGTRACSYLGYNKLANISYIQAESRIRQLSPREALPIKHPNKNFNFSQLHGDWKHRRSVEGSSNGSLLVPWPVVNDTWIPEDFSSLEFLHELRNVSRGGRKKRDLCNQAVVSCERESCGKAPLYFFSKDTPVGMAGGLPWAGTVYVDGRHRCGGTLIRPHWVITSNTCMEGISLQRSMVSMVMGSRRLVGSPTRLWGGHEHDRRVTYMKAVPNTDILLLRLEDRMPKTPYISHLCLPTENVEQVETGKKCAMGGLHEVEGRISGVVLQLEEDCQDGYLCLQRDRKDLPCMRSWSGIVACQYTHESNPTWVGVGVWAYQNPDRNCSSVTHHLLFTIDILMGINAIIEVYTPVPLMECKGTKCVTAVCVNQEELCDADLSCPDHSDEPSNCPTLVTMCTPDLKTGMCVCPEGGAPCRDGMCLPLRKMCDGVPDCPDATDETNCVCCRYLSGNTPEKVCDGYLDCSDQSDEAYCGCQPSSQWFRCYASEGRVCVARTKVCDGVKDCSSGEDEQHCVALAPVVHVQEDVLGVPENHTQGYLLVRLSGLWHTYLFSMWEPYLSHLVCLQLGYYRANSTDPRSLDINAVSKAARSMGVRRDYSGILNPLNYSLKGTNTTTLVYITCVEEDPKGDRLKTI